MVRVGGRWRKLYLNNNKKKLKRRKKWSEKSKGLHCMLCYVMDSRSKTETMKISTNRQVKKCLSQV